LLRIGNRRHDIVKRIWSELTHEAIYTVVVRNCGMDELFFQLAVCPANHFNGSRAEFEVECGGAACTYGDVVSREPLPLMLRLSGRSLASRSRLGN
jgi:hypothetical protein